MTRVILDSLVFNASIFQKPVEEGLSRLKAISVVEIWDVSVEAYMTRFAGWECGRAAGFAEEPTLRACIEMALVHSQLTLCRDLGDEACPLRATAP